MCDVTPSGPPWMIPDLISSICKRKRAGLDAHCQTLLPWILGLDRDDRRPAGGEGGRGNGEAFIHLGCCNNTAHAGWLVSHRDFLLTVLETISPGSGCQTVGPEPSPGSLMSSCILTQWRRQGSSFIRT